MVRFYSAFVLATAISAASIVKRDVSTVLANLQTIDSETDTLAATITAWDGTLLGALGIQSVVATLENDITSATTEAQTESVASSADSTTILTYVSGTLTPDLVAALDALDARQSEIAALGANNLVLQDLETLQSDTDALGAALVALASSDTTTEATTAVSAIDAAFASAIAVYST